MTAAGGRMVVKSRESSEELQSKGKKHSKLTYLVEKSQPTAPILVFIDQTLKLLL